MTVAFIRTGSAPALPEHAGAREIASDEVLIRRIAGGDQLAMQTLFVRHRVALYRWLLRLVGEEALAEDLLSDVFLDVWRQAAAFEARSSVSTWLLAIARHKALSARRRRTDAELDEKVAFEGGGPGGRPGGRAAKENPGRTAAPRLGAAVAGARRGHRPRLLSRQIGQRGRGDRRHRRGHCEDAHVLCAQEIGRAGRDNVAAKQQDGRALSDAPSGAWR